ncbi:SLOG family protein [Klebsiella pneumoniae]|uniref:SLOG family protein n=1 Tax=Klebsiella pneumoniae TaxID=573 RepID=UPI000D1C07BD|nr:SLOG family protein [Klebsiella pneumoniae]
MARFKVMVSGCRHYRNYFLFARHMDKLIARFPRDEVVILEGGDAGCNYLAFLYALRRGIPCLTFPADWDNKGKSAGFIRNAEMMAAATHCVTFWDGESKGTGDVVRRIAEYHVSYRSVTIPKGGKNEKPRRSHRNWRKVDGRTLSRIRKRHAVS